MRPFCAFLCLVLLGCNILELFSGYLFLFLFIYPIRDHKRRSLSATTSTPPGPAIPPPPAGSAIPTPPTRPAISTAAMATMPSTTITTTVSTATTLAATMIITTSVATIAQSTFLATDKVGVQISLRQNLTLTDPYLDTDLPINSQRKYIRIID